MLPNTKYIFYNTFTFEFLQYTQPRLLEYAGRHRYKVRLFAEPANSTYTAHWQKLLWLRYLLTGGTNASIIAFFDDDIFITNLSVRIENFFSLVNDAEKIHFIASRDSWVNNYKFLINSGTLLIRNSRKSLDFVKYALKLYDEIPHIQHFVHLDQDAIIIAHLEYFYEHSLLLPFCVLQSMWSTNADMYTWKPGHFALHHLWSHYDDRMENFAQLYTNISAWWEKNLPNTTTSTNCDDETI